GVDLFSAGRQERRERRLGEPLHLQTGNLATKLPSERHVAPGVAEADRRADQQWARRAVLASSPWCRRLAIHKLADEPVHAHGVARHRDVPGALEQYIAAVCELGEDLASLDGLAVVAIALHDQDRTLNLPAESFDLLFRVGRELLLHEQRFHVAV